MKICIDLAIGMLWRLTTGHIDILLSLHNVYLQSMVRETIDVEK